MHHLVASIVLALHAASSAPATSSLAPETSDSRDSRAWESLDRDLELLAAGVQAPSGFRVDGLVRAFFIHADDSTIFAPPNDVSGFLLDHVQVAFEGAAGDYGVRIQIEAAPPAGTGPSVLNLLDAYASWNITPHVQTLFGNFRIPVLWEALLDDENTLFLVRTDVGTLAYARQLGAQVRGAYEKLHWAVALQNGADGPADENAISGRLGLDILGDGVGMRQGAYGAPVESRLTASVGFFDDSSAPDDGQVLAFDTQFTRGRFAADAHLVDFGDDPAFWGPRTDSQPFAVTASYMISPDAWEAAARWQDLDNVDDDQDLTLGINRYIAGHNVKWQLNFIDISSDVSAKDGEQRIGLGLTVKV
jgi:hypothetical protein